MKCGVLGCGHFSKTHRDILQKDLPGKVEFVACYSRSKDKAEEFAKSCSETCTPFYGETYGDEFFKNLDFCLVLLPIPQLPDAVKKCFEKNVNVLSEKPVAPSLEAANELIAMYRGKYSHLVWNVGENYRCEKAFNVARDELNKIGTAKGFLLLANQAFSTSIPPFTTPWRMNPDFKHAYLLDVGVHHIAALREIFRGTVLEVKSCLLSKQWKEMPGKHDSMISVVSSGAVHGTVSISAGQFGKREWEFKVFGDKGQMNICREGMGYRITIENAKEKLFDEWYGWDGILEEWKIFLQQQKGNVDVKSKLSPEEAREDLKFLLQMLEHNYNNNSIESILM